MMSILKISIKLGRVSTNSSLTSARGFLSLNIDLLLKQNIFSAFEPFGALSDI